MIEKKAIGFAVVLVFLTGVLGGCGEKDASSASQTDPTQPKESAATLVERVLQEAPNEKITKTVSYGEDTYAEYFSYLYDLDLSLVSDGSIAYAAAGGYADELSILYVADEQNVSRVKSALNARIERRQNDFRGYVPAEMPKLEAACVMTSGNYVVLSICDDQEQTQAAIQKLLT